ncbi:MAG: GNAT family N-acetyltransferase [Myxococcota bacterium]
MSDESFEVRFEDGETRGRFVLLVEGTQKGEMTFSRATPDMVIVDHTETDESLRGRGAGKRLFDAMVAWARETGTKVTATCPFALAMFQRHPETQDVQL